jgi:ribosomal protein S18 acetylase RimI-like enzyme
MKREVTMEQLEAISLCTVKPSDEEFLLKLFIESRPDLSFISGVSEDQRVGIILEQFNIEQHQLRQIYPRAEFNIVMLWDEPIGRLYVNHEVTEDRIIEIGLLEEYRNKGIGGKLLNSIIENSNRMGKNISLQVAWFNHGAYAFYERHGFKTIENNGVFCEMRYNIV